MHAHKEQHKIDWKESRAIKFIPNQQEREIAEALYINKIKPKLNLTEGVKLHSELNWE